MISKLVSILFTLWKGMLIPEVLLVISFFFIVAVIEGSSITKRELWTKMSLIYTVITIDLLIHGIYFEDKVSDVALTTITIVFMVSFVITAIFLVCLIRAIRKNR